MEKITEHAMHELLSMPATGLAATIYIPLHTSAAPPHIAEDQIRLKNLIHHAERQLKDRPDGQQLAHALTQWHESVSGSTSLWDSHANGMLLCAYGDTVRTFQLPIDTEEYVSIDTTLHLAPIVGLLSEAQNFYVLGVSQHHPCLFSGGLYGLEPSNVALPKNVTEALHIDENNQKSEQALSAGGSSMNTNAFNGRGGARDPRQDDHQRFLRLIDKMVVSNTDHSLPLILAGTEAEVAAYRAISKYPYILQATIGGATSGMSPEQLFGEAQAIISDELITPQHQQAIATFERMHATTSERTAQRFDDLQAAAEQGRIATLLIGMSRFTTDTIQDSQQPRPRLTFSRDALQRIIHGVALAVHNTKGRVVMLDERTLPGGVPAAATLRY